MSLHFLKGIVMWYMHLPFRIRQYKRNNERNLQRIKKKDKITVVFFASNLAMWRYQGLYEEMQKYPRFVSHIVLSPLNGTFQKEQVEKDINDLRAFFENKGIAYYDYDLQKMKGYDVHSLSPDLMFYPQPYMTAMRKEHRFYRFPDCLLCYYPYGFYYHNIKEFYNDLFQTKAWKLFHENSFTKSCYERYSPMCGYNVEVTGYPNYDFFIRSRKDVWKKQEKAKKRIIWAPHFTIYNDGWMQNSVFLEVADFMVSIREKYKEEIQFAFKPHPRLLSELYKHPLWGKEKSDAYYKGWECSDNSQLEERDYIDLFVSSDAMIHDSGSFAAEYLFTANPVLYTANNMEELYTNVNEFGKMVYDNHYHGGNKEDIYRFITDVVLEGNDVKKLQRQEFHSRYLQAPNDKTVAENTVDILINELSL